MKNFRCQCGQQLFFDSQSCIRCGRRLGFDVENMEMVALSGDQATHSRLCANSEYGVCNWVIPESSTHSLCFACQFNRTIPYLGKPENVTRWRVLESAKKRLFYTLLRLGLPLVSGHVDTQHGLLFDFVEDARSDPNRYPEKFVHTGYANGVITVNVLEADDAARESMKAALRESYRSVLGHLRHESGHFYWSHLQVALTAEFKQLFGDSQADYAAALEKHYADGPPADWNQRFISAYASAHPLEDWAETWGHYLHIFDLLETAATHGLIDVQFDQMDMQAQISLWRKLSVTLNELNRSIGLGDAYPFIVTDLVQEKLTFIDRAIKSLKTPHSAQAGY
ncbi:MAG: putative zinc-binding metallopeptidase [Pseudomonadota bacterium]